MSIQSTPQKNPTKFFSWDGKFGKFIDVWYKKRHWNWFIIIIITMTWYGFDLGQLVTRADLLSGAQNIQGNITIERMLEKSEDGGRLIITSKDNARFIDNAGKTWNIFDFSKKISQEDIEQLENNNVSIDGTFSVIVRPVKVRANDLIMASIADLAMKLTIIFIYVAVFYLIFRYFSKSRGGRYKKIDAKTPVNVTIKDVAGYNGVKDELLEVVQYLKNPERFTRVGANPPRGVLLHGPPGNGKTLLAKAVAGEAAASFFEQSASSFVRIFAGEGAKSVGQLFDQARKNKPSVIFIDEIDAIGGARNSGSNDERVQTLNAILTEMDGFSDNEDIVVVAATNRIDTLDNALIRPGRFDRKVWIGMPTLFDRVEILQRHSDKIKISQDVDWALWARQTKGFSGAELAALVNESAIEAARDNKDEVNGEHIARARDRVWIGAKNHGQILTDEERKIIAVHELGHAWVRLKTGGRVEKVSIEPRGQSLGVTVSISDDEKFLYNQKDVENELAVLMAGRAAEMIVYNKITGGAADDMNKASALAREASLRLGNDKWGAYIPIDANEENIQKSAAKMVNDAFDKSCDVIKKEIKVFLSAKKALLEKDELNEKELLSLWDLSYSDGTGDGSDGVGG